MVILAKMKEDENLDEYDDFRKLIATAVKTAMKGTEIVKEKKAGLALPISPTKKTKAPVVDETN